MRIHRIVLGTMSALLVATGIPLLANPAQANGNCVSFWGSRGSGTVANPYPVASQLDLEEVNYCRDKVFRQTADITLTGAWTPLGDGFTPFAGTYDGNGFAIRGLSINEPTLSERGLFGQLVNATLRDVTVSGSVIGDDSVGGLVGSAYTSVIEDCHANVAVGVGVSSPDAEQVGGLIGYSTTSTITGSSASGAVTFPDGGVGPGESFGGLIGLSERDTVTRSWATGAVHGGQDAGGLIGFFYGGSLTTSYATGDVSSQGWSGGLIGRADGTGPAPNEIADTFARGSVTGATSFVSGSWIGRTDSVQTSRSFATGAMNPPGDLGGFAGEDNTGTWTANFWDVTTTGIATARFAGAITGVTGLATSAMTDIAAYRAAGWNIGGWAALGATWGICAGVNDGYPYLQAFYASNPCEDGPTPPPWPQAYARASGDTCQPGWNPSWAEWPNGNTGGFVCQRTLVYNRSTGQWDARRLVHARI